MASFPHVLISVASREDAEVTCAALEPYLDDVERVTAVHVIEKAGGAPDKAPLEKRQADGEQFLDIVETRLGAAVDVETRLAYGTDVTETLFDQAREVDVDAIAFHARGGSRLTRLLTGDTATKLVTGPPVPVIALPDPE